MTTYTVTEDRSKFGTIFWVNENGLPRWAFRSRGVADQKARWENMKRRAEEMLALLVESRDGIITAHSYDASWEGRRDALIAEINGEREGA